MNKYYLVRGTTGYLVVFKDWDGIDLFVGAENKLYCSQKVYDRTEDGELYSYDHVTLCGTIIETFETKEAAEDKLKEHENGI